MASIENVHFKLVMALLSTFIVLALITTPANSYVYTKIGSDYNGRCKDENGELHSVGESWTYKKRCELATCVRVNDKLYEEVMGCIKVSAQKGCRLTPSLGSSFPSCCPSLRCNSLASKDNVRFISSSAF